MALNDSWLKAANGRWREDEDLLRARREATSPGRGVKPPASEHSLTSPTVVCARFACAPLVGIRFADGLSAGGYEGVRLAEAEGRAAKRSQEPERKYLSPLHIT